MKDKKLNILVTGGNGQLGRTYNFIGLVKNRLCFQRKSYRLEFLIDKSVLCRFCIIIAFVKLIITCQLQNLILAHPEELVVDIPFFSFEIYLPQGSLIAFTFK